MYKYDYDHNKKILTIKKEDKVVCEAVVQKEGNNAKIIFGKIENIDELDLNFVSEATKAGLVSLKGHRVTGGMRASIYNAMPIEGVKALIEFMKKFEMENK